MSLTHLEIMLLTNYLLSDFICILQSAGAVEYTDCTSVEE